MYFSLNWRCKNNVTLKIAVAAYIELLQQSAHYQQTSQQYKLYSHLANFVYRFVNKVSLPFIQATVPQSGFRLLIFS